MSANCNKNGEHGCSHQTGWNINGQWFCENHWSVLSKSKLGTVSADNADDPESLDFIRYGGIEGTGLLGAVLEAGLRLCEFEREAGYFSSGLPEELSESLKQQRVIFYESLKAIERIA